MHYVFPLNGKSSFFLSNEKLRRDHWDGSVCSLCSWKFLRLHRCQLMWSMLRLLLTESSPTRRQANRREEMPHVTSWSLRWQRWGNVQATSLSYDFWRMALAFSSNTFPQLVERNTSVHSRKVTPHTQQSPINTPQMGFSVSPITYSHVILYVCAPAPRLTVNQWYSPNMLDYNRNYFSYRNYDLPSSHVQRKLGTDILNV